MPKSVVLISLRDPSRAEHLAAALEEDGGFLPVLGESAFGAADAAVTDAPGFGRGLPRVLLSADRSADAAARLPADADDALVTAALRLVAAGYRLVARDEPDAEPETSEDAAPSYSGPPLSARELEVLALLADGASNKLIARRLDISVHTAKFHVASILSKLGATNRTDAIGIAMRQGLVLV